MGQLVPLSLGHGAHAATAEQDDVKDGSRSTSSETAAALESRVQQHVTILNLTKDLQEVRGDMKRQLSEMADMKRQLSRLLLHVVDGGEEAADAENENAAPGGGGDSGASSGGSGGGGARRRGPLSVVAAADALTHVASSGSTKLGLVSDQGIDLTVGSTTIATASSTGLAVTGALTVTGYVKPTAVGCLGGALRVEFSLTRSLKAPGPGFKSFPIK
jgi:hypothetical protein